MHTFVVKFRKVRAALIAYFKTMQQLTTGTSSITKRWNVTQFKNYAEKREESFAFFHSTRKEQNSKRRF